MATCRARKATKAKAEPLGVTPRRNGTYLFAGEYFTEEVRREIIARYGEDALYEGGLSVRTTLDPKMQLIARKAMQNGLLKYDTLRGYRGPRDARSNVAGDWGVRAGRGQGPGRRARMAAGRRARKLAMTGLSIGLQPKREDFRRSRRRARDRHRVAKEDMSLAMRHVVDGKTRQGQVAGRGAEAGRRRLRPEEGRAAATIAAPGAGSRRAAWSRWIRTPGACWR